jgi:ferredoxin
VLLLGFPVYGGRMPRFLRSYLDALPAPAGGRLYLFATYGLYPANALRAAALQCARRGFVPAGTAEFKLPGSDGLAFLSKESRKAQKAEQTDFRAEPRIRENLESLGEAAAAGAAEGPAEQGQAAQEFAAGLSAYRRRSFIADLLLRGALRCMEKSISRRLTADRACIRCGTCLSICPTANISLPPAGPPQFGDRCALCLRCLHQCPEEVIQLGRRSRGGFRWKGPDGSYRPPVLRSPAAAGTTSPPSPEEDPRGSAQ